MENIDLKEKFQIGIYDACSIFTDTTLFNLLTDMDIPVEKHYFIGYYEYFGKSDLSDIMLIINHKNRKYSVCVGAMKVGFTDKPIMLHLSDYQCPKRDISIDLHCFDEVVDLIKENINQFILRDFEQLSLF